MHSLVRRAASGLLALVVIASGALVAQESATALDQRSSGAVARPPVGELPQTDILPVDRLVLGGCLVRFDTKGRPVLGATLGRPCIGARSVALSSVGDVVVTLAPGADLPQARMLLSADATLASRGISVGGTRVGRTIALRFYDDRLRTRLDLRRSAHRVRAASGGASLGWVGAAKASTASLDPGIRAYGRYRDRLATSETTVGGGCVIRFSESGPWIHANGTHHCTGVRKVGISSAGRLAVTYSDEQRGSVISASADPDETLVRRGITTGVTTSTQQLQVQLYDTVKNRPVDLRRLGDRRRVAGRFANMWLSWTKSTSHPDLVTARTDPATDKYGPFVNGSAAAGTVLQAGCQVRFSASGAEPYAHESSGSLCTGVATVFVNESGALQVTGDAGVADPVISTTTVSSRSLTDYGIRAGASGGGRSTRYSFYSIRLERPLDLRRRADRDLLRRSGSSVEIGWSRPASVPKPPPTPPPTTPPTSPPTTSTSTTSEPTSTTSTPVETTPDPTSTSPQPTATSTSTSGD